MRPSHTFHVAARVPEKLEPLRELAYNLRWCWDHDTIELFRRIDPELWEESGHNPVRMLALVSQDQLNSCADDEGFMGHLNRVHSGLKEYTTSAERSKDAVETALPPLVAYFSAEFGITECLPLYAGGMGVLSGDYLKSSSDIGLRVVGMGILYRQGYLNQYLNPDGWQQEEYSDTDFYNAPVRLMRRDGHPVTVDIPHPAPPARAQIWCAQVGRVPLYLLDMNLPGNSEPARKVSERLYAQGGEMRMQQEILLGIGGVRALSALGINPVVYHMNEGHSAFLSLERVRTMMKEHALSFEEARVATIAGNVFTTHTPVPAGSDRFGTEIVEKYLGQYIQELGITTKDLMAMGKENAGDLNEHSPLCTTALAFRMAAYSFGVSRLHGGISRRIWKDVWPGVPEEEVPIAAVRNGVHIPSWVSNEMAQLFNRYLGPHWASRPSRPESWRRIDGIPDQELWETHERRRLRLITFVRRCLREQLKRHGRLAGEVDAADSTLDPNVLTVVFARRFAAYKRPYLLFQDVERLKRILNNPDRPAQIIFAGKAHPADQQAKELMKDIIHRMRDEQLRQRMIFLENYDMNAARYLIQGADVWLNTPRRPLEASGTSGVKAAANGVLHLSTLDGWWAEGYEPGIGWAIGRGEQYGDSTYQDAVEAQALYDILEREVIPLFYNRGGDGLPRQWIAMMKSSIRKICPAFSSARMVTEYEQEFYVPAAQRASVLHENEFERARRLAQWKDRVRLAWPQVAIKKVETTSLEGLQVESVFRVRVLVHLAGLTRDEASVVLYSGKLNSQTDIFNLRTVPLTPEKSGEKDEEWFAGEVNCDSSGRHGFSVGILPRHPDLSNPYEMNLILWG